MSEEWLFDVERPFEGILVTGNPNEPGAFILDAPWAMQRFVLFVNDGWMYDVEGAIAFSRFVDNTNLKFWQRVDCAECLSATATVAMPCTDLLCEDCAKEHGPCAMCDYDGVEFPRGEFGNYESERGKSLDNHPNPREQ